MSEFEDKLGAILGNPEAMTQIMSLAQSLGGSSSASSEDEDASPPSPSSPVSSTSDSSLPNTGDLMGLLGNIDPQLIQKGLHLYAELSQGEDQRVALLTALRPFLKEARQEKIDRAIQIARMTRLLRAGFRLFQGKGEDDV